MRDESVQAALKAHPLADLAWLKRRREKIIEPDLAIVDPHHHLWDRPGNRYLFEEAFDDFAPGHQVIATVHVEGRYMYRTTGPDEFKSLGETEFINGVASRSATGLSGPLKMCAGIVGPVDLLLGERVEPILAAHLAAGDGRFRGVRPTILWHENSEVLAVKNPRGVLSRSEAAAALRCVSKLGLSLDIWAFFTQMDEVLEVCREHPDLIVVINHFGGPLGIGPYAGRPDESFEDWREAMRRVATCENAVIKLGGLGMRYAGFEFNTLTDPPSSDLLAQSWRPYIEECIGLFGPQRCMFESNFPVDRGMYSYEILWNAFKKVTSNLSTSERARLFRETAAQVYRLSI
jgi:L-fuconolactonase